MSFKKVISGTAFRFIKVKKEFMYGIIEKEIAGGKVLITDKERTMIDLLYWNAAVGGINAAMKIFENIVREKDCDIQKLIEYAVIYPRLTIRKIIGVILDNVFKAEKLTEPLYETIKYSSLGSTRGKQRSGKINNRWRLIIQ
jgi:predicted transcriptional regulator of viral defense system